MQTIETAAREKEKEFKTENMVWTRIYYGREVMERILETIDIKRALHQRFFLRYTLRALEILLLTGSAASARSRDEDAWSGRRRVLKVCIWPDRAALGVRIESRVRRMLDAGWDEEVRALLDRGLSVESNSFQAIGYREVAEWVLGRTSKEEAQQRIVKATRGLAKRQSTWLRREADARRVNPEEALDVILALVGETGEGER